MGWIKWQHGFETKPEVLRTATAIGLTLEASAVLWMRLLCWFDTQTEDGRTTAEPTEIDAAMGWPPGRTQALIDLGLWLTRETGVITLENYERHNGQNAKRRALGNDRWQRWKANHPD
jgi:hypothetical protein